MKEMIKAIIPRALVSAARELYRCTISPTPVIKHAYAGVEKIGALRGVISYNKYGGYCIPESSLHRPAANAVLSGQVYEPDTIEFMIINCGSRDVIHAGTFFGDFLPALAKAVDPDALVWAFEPNRENFRCAAITIALNESSNVRLTNAGLGERHQQLYVQTVDICGMSLGGASRIVTTCDGPEKKESVEIVAIDETIPADRSIGILQLDVEGYEKEALFGAIATIRRCLPILIIEVLHNSELERSKWFLDYILGLGYQKVKKLHGNSVYACIAPKEHS